MNLILIGNIFTCAGAFFGFNYGITKFFKPKKAVYAQMITFACGCMAFGRLYQIVRLLTAGDIFERFQLGVLGVFGGLVFLFSANFGLMDSLADDGSKKYLKYRLIPLVAPAAAVAAYLVFFAFKDYPLLVKIMAGLVCLFAAQSSYYNLKHFIFPDVDFGVINSLKLYNLLSLIFSALCVAEVIAYSRINEVLSLVIGILLGIDLMLITPAVERGIKKWTT